MKRKHGLARNPDTVNSQMPKTVQTEFLKIIADIANSVKFTRRVVTENPSQSAAAFGALEEQIKENFAKIKLLQQQTEPSKNIVTEGAIGILNSGLDLLDIQKICEVGGTMVKSAVDWVAKSVANDSTHDSTSHSAHESTSHSTHDSTNHAGHDSTTDSSSDSGGDSSSDSSGDSGSDSGD